MVNKPAYRREREAARLRIGVLALQGCVTPHRAHLESCGAEYIEVRSRNELELVEGLILPGGESTTMLKLIDVFGLEPSLIAAFARIPTWGICAGAILMARQVTGPTQKSFGIFDCDVERNAYGRQLDSFETEVDGYPVSFIRAPRISRYGDGVRVIAVENNDPIWLAHGMHRISTFHPELTTDYPSPMHREFCAQVSIGRTRLPARSMSSS